MRRLGELLVLLAGIGVILAVARGFPALGRGLLFLLTNPVGLLCVGGLTAWVAVRRHRARNRAEVRR
ncbi:MAG: hypothetical protein KDC87_09695 [Planctomycetes bacterium]|nr:hypothetical protein [Planctomycetota bacterium]